jgi:cellulose synthase/poly-beta-1,6-N-acetylglucosamine synthase-like glycosyltransferase
MTQLLNVLTAIYLFCAILLTLYAAGALVLLIAYLRNRNRVIETPTLTEYPKVAIQLPIYNEMFVVERLLDAMAKLDYPREKLIVQVLDDSTDATVQIVARKVEALRAEGLDVRHVRRGSRAGYKAGALAYGLTQMDAEFVAVLDADFVAPPDFLSKTIPHLVANPELAVVQGRWGHLNTDDNLLTRGQTLALDGHFVVEQTGRNRSGWLMNFNGSGGIWRVKAIEDAGGWKDNTLTEDLDLSYRAQLNGWDFLYLPDVVVPGELPPQISAYKQQQSRWAKGGSQCFRLLMGPIWTSKRLTWVQRYMATMHLGQYMVHPVIILLVLLTPPLVMAGKLQELSLGILGFAGLGPPLVFIISQQALYTDWRRRLLAFPALLALGTGMAFCNAVAVIGGLIGHKEEFKRTPKYVQGMQSNIYALGINPTIYVEMLLSLYALAGALLAVREMPEIVPYLMLYAVAFGAVAVWGVVDWLNLRRSSSTPPTPPPNPVTV